jgi:nitrite reductase/ring-hydroxylating ferredoxin subunit
MHPHCTSSLTNKSCNFNADEYILPSSFPIMLTWFKIAGSSDELLLGPNGIAVIELRNKMICLAKHGEQWHGFAYKCPHASGIMANGHLDVMGNVVCPVHRYRFSLKNGRNTSGEGYYLKTYPVEERPDGIYLGMSTGFFS